MPESSRSYAYVGPAEIRDQVTDVEAVAVHTPGALDAWLARCEPAERLEPFTFVVALDGALRLAPRRSEHVAAVAAALDRLNLRRLGDLTDFTDKVVFRRCPACQERNIVREDDFTCALCDSPLPAKWNFGSL